VACDGGFTSNRALTDLPACGVMMVVVVTMMVRLRKCGSRNHQDQGKKQSLFHVLDHSNKGATPMPLRINFRVTPQPQWCYARHQEKSSSALTTALRLCRVRKKKTTVISRYTK